MSQPSKPTPADYALIFEDHRVGAAIFEDLVQRFARGAVTSGGIDAVLQTYQHAGMRKVLDYITLRINQTHGVPDPNADNQE